MAVRWKPVGIAAVEVLFPRDMHLVDDVHVHRQADFDGHVHGRLVDQERRRVVHLVGADVLMIEEIDDLLLRFEFHQRGAVVFAQFAERGPHVAEHFAVVAFGIEAGGAAAKELVFGEELLVHFESGHQADGWIIELLDHCDPSFAGAS